MCPSEKLSKSDLDPGRVTDRVPVGGTVGNVFRKQSHYPTGDESRHTKPKKTSKRSTFYFHWSPIRHQGDTRSTPTVNHPTQTNPSWVSLPVVVPPRVGE